MELTGLIDFETYAPAMMGAVIVLGMLTGILTGMFGIGGAFITTPILISFFAIEPTTAVACAFGYTIGGGFLGIRKHKQLGHINWKIVSAVGLSACVGITIGFFFHQQLAVALGDSFKQVVTGAFLVLLLPIAWLVGRQKTIESGYVANPVLAKIKLPPYCRVEGTTLISLWSLILCGLMLGFIRGSLGIGGGVILIPLLVFFVGMKPHNAVGTSLGIILLGSVVGCFLYGGAMNWLIVLLLVGGGWFGIQLGSRVCHYLAADQLRRAFALVILLFAGMMVIDLSFDLFPPLADNVTRTTVSATALRGW